MPATLEMIRLAKGGTTLATRERPTSEAMPETSQGEPSIGKSLGITVLTRLIIALPASEDSWMTFNRSTGSATSVPSVMRSMLTWLLADSSPEARRLTGTAATSGFSGRSSYSRR